MLREMNISVLAVAILTFAAAAAAQTNSNVGYALTDTPAEQLITFGPTGGGPDFPITSAHFITGLQPNEQLLRIRKAEDGTLYGIGSQSRLYTVSATGIASLVLPFNPPLNGTVVGFAVEAGRATIVTNLGQNLQLDLAGHVLSVGGGLTYAPGQVASGMAVQGAPVIEDIAYSPGPNPQLYGIDANSQTLVKIVGAGDPSGGKVYTVNQEQALVTIVPSSSLDFLADGTPVFTAQERESNGAVGTFLYAVDFSGAGFPTLGRIGDGGTDVGVRAIAVPEPQVFAVLFTACLVVRRRSSARSPGDKVGPL